MVSREGPGGGPVASHTQEITRSIEISSENSEQNRPAGNMKMCGQNLFLPEASTPEPD
jgi:hypothetical protein